MDGESNFNIEMFFKTLEQKIAAENEKKDIQIKSLTETVKALESKLDKQEYKNEEFRKKQEQKFEDVYEMKSAILLLTETVKDLKTVVDGLQNRPANFLNSFFTAIAGAAGGFFFSQIFNKK